MISGRGSGYAVYIIVWLLQYNEHIVYRAPASFCDVIHSDTGRIELAAYEVMCIEVCRDQVAHTDIP